MYPGLPDEPGEYAPAYMGQDAIPLALEKSFEKCRLLDEARLDRVFEHITDKLEPFFVRKALTYEEAVETVDPSKSPGFPWTHVYHLQTKADVMERMPELLKQMVMALLSGDEDVVTSFTGQLKPELRTVARVLAKKTRFFCGSPFHLQLLNCMLFYTSYQNIMDHLEEHPIKIGIQLPGPSFIRFMSSLGDRANDGDGSGFDLRYALQVARRVRNLHYRMTEEQYIKAVCIAFNAVFAGTVCVGNRVYRLFKQKSGDFKTSMANSICEWSYVLYGVDLILGPYAFRQEMLSEGYVGDDLAVAMKNLSLKQIADKLEPLGIYIEIEDAIPRSYMEVVFLSHSLVWRYVACMQRNIVVAAGNLPKLASSLRWVKKSETLNWQEAQVAHLIGVRLCLFPWPHYWALCDEVLDKLLVGVTMTPFIRGCLKARLNEWEMVRLHTRYESAVFPTSIVDITGRLKSFGRLFKECFSSALIYDDVEQLLLQLGGYNHLQIA